MAEDGEGNTSPSFYAHLVSRPPTLTDEEPGQESPYEIGPDDISPEPFHSNPEEGEGSSSVQALATLSGNQPCPENENPCGKYGWKGAMRYAERWTLWGQSNDEVSEHHNHEFQYLGGNGGVAPTSRARFYGVAICSSCAPTGTIRLIWMRMEKTTSKTTNTVTGHGGRPTSTSTTNRRSSSPDQPSPGTMPRSFFEHLVEYGLADKRQTGASWRHYLLRPSPRYGHRRYRSQPGSRASDA